MTAPVNAGHQHRNQHQSKPIHADEHLSESRDHAMTSTLPSSISGQLAPVSLRIRERLEAAGVPYLVYRLALAKGLPSTLEQLSPTYLSALIFLHAVATSGLHSLWYAMRGVSQSFLSGFSVMFIGDLMGTLIIIYLIKLLLMVWDRMSNVTPPI